MLQNKKIIVTGGAGFIGSAVIRQLIEQHQAIVLNFDALTYAGDLKTVSSVADNERYTFFRGDIRQAKDIKAALNEFQPDAVMHLAAESHVDRSIDSADDFITTNINGTHTLLNETYAYYDGLSQEKKESFRFVHISTDEVYGSLGKDDAPFDRATPYQPNSPYSASKAASDHLVRAWHQTYKFPAIITHCSNNYGPYQYPEKLIPVVIKKILAKEDIPVYGSGENIRDWIFVEDHAAALLVVLEKGQIGQVYNIGGECELSNINLVKNICEMMDQIKPCEAGSYQRLISFVGDRKGHDFRYAIENDQITEELNWVPKMTFAQGLKETIEWYLSHQEWLVK